MLIDFNPLYNLTVKGKFNFDLHPDIGSKICTKLFRVGVTVLRLLKLNSISDNCQYIFLTR